MWQESKVGVVSTLVFQIKMPRTRVLCESGIDLGLKILKFLHVIVNAALKCASSWNILRTSLQKEGDTKGPLRSTYFACGLRQKEEEEETRRKEPFPMIRLISLDTDCSAIPSLFSSYTRVRVACALNKVRHVDCVGKYLTSATTRREIRGAHLGALRALFAFNWWK